MIVWRRVAATVAALSAGLSPPLKRLARPLDVLTSLIFWRSLSSLSLSLSASSEASSRAVFRPLLPGFFSSFAIASAIRELATSSAELIPETSFAASFQASACFFAASSFFLMNSVIFSVTLTTTSIRAKTTTASNARFIAAVTPGSLLMIP